MIEDGFVLFVNAIATITCTVACVGNIVQGDAVWAAGLAGLAVLNLMLFIQSLHRKVSNL